MPLALASIGYIYPYHVLYNLFCPCREEFESFQKSLGYEGSDFGQCFSGLFSIVRSAIRNRTKLSVVRNDLTQMNVPDAMIPEILSAIRDNRFELEDAVVLHRVKPPSLNKLRVFLSFFFSHILFFFFFFFFFFLIVQWRLDVIISTGSLSRVFVPQFLVEMRLSNGQIRSFYMTANQVQGLRFQVAKVLRAMQEVERHPIMRLGLFVLCIFNLVLSFSSLSPFLKKLLSRIS